MKTTAITTISSGSYIPELEEIIQKKDAYLKELARKNGKHFAQTNLPAPFGDSLLPYFGELKSGYEELAAQTCQFLLPDMHIPEAKLETDFAKEKIKQIDEEVKKREEQNRNDQYDLGDYNPGNIPMRIKTALISTGVIGVGEIAFNTKAFSVTGENLLFSLVISTSATFAVFILSHVAPLLYKSAETKEKKIAVVLGSLILSTALFIAMAVLRSKLLEKQDMSISPVFFVIINMFFFIVSALLSYYLLPSWQEIVKHWNASKLLKAIAKRKEEITELKKEKETLKVKSIELTKAHLRMPVYAAYTIERIKKMYREAAELFKTVNLTYRTDRQMPDCFHDELPELDIPYLHNQYSLNNNEQ